MIDQVNNQVGHYRDLFNIPRQCLLCKSTVYQKNICIYCDRLLIRLAKKCKRCHWPIANSMAHCELCIHQKIKVTHSYDNNNDNLDDFIWSDIKIAFAYTDPIDRIIQQFKYLGDLTKGRLLADLLLKYLQQSYIQPLESLKLPEVIIPVPIYSAKLKLRGFNQSTEVARYISKKLNIPVDTSLVAKFLPSDPQMGLDKNARITNIEQTFCLNKKAKYKSAVIIDDVVTTGSTVNAIAKLLQKTHIKNISLWAIARRC